MMRTFILLIAIAMTAASCERKDNAAAPVSADTKPAKQDKQQIDSTKKVDSTVQDPINDTILHQQDSVIDFHVTEE